MPSLMKASFMRALAPAMRTSAASAMAKAPAAGRAVNERNDGLRAPPHQPDDRREAGRWAALVETRKLLGGIAAGFQIEAGAERRAGAAHDDDAPGIVVLEIPEIVPEFADHRSRNGVQALRPI